MYICTIRYGPYINFYIVVHRLYIICLTIHHRPNINNI